VRGEKRREQDRDRGAIERVRRHRILARHLQLAHDEECDRDRDADHHAHRGLQPALFYRVAEEVDRRQREHDTGDPREQLDADEALPVDVREESA
jgi:hypothetical protein